jgi:hypothetical protein
MRFKIGPLPVSDCHQHFAASLLLFRHRQTQRLSDNFPTVTGTVFALVSKLRWRLCDVRACPADSS